MAFPLAALIPAVLNVCRAVAVVATTISAVATAISTITNALGLTKTDNPAELGEKALMAEEENIKPEDFSTYEEYVKRIEELELDPEKSSRWTKEQKESRGLEVGTSLLVEKYGIEAESIILEIAKRPQFFTAERGKFYLEQSSNANIDLTRISDLLNNKLDDFEEILQAKNDMYEIEKTIDPNLSPIDHADLVHNLRTSEQH